VNLLMAVLCEETEQVAKRSTGMVEQPSLPAGMAPQGLGVQLNFQKQ
jgi:hypothetical protein